MRKLPLAAFGWVEYIVSVPLRGLDMRKPTSIKALLIRRLGFSPLAGIRYAETCLFCLDLHVIEGVFQSPCGD